MIVESHKFCVWFSELGEVTLKNSRKVLPEIESAYVFLKGNK